jgi:hypothetical protein
MRQHYPEKTGIRAPLERYCPLISDAKGAPRSCPAGSIAQVGFGSAALSRTDAAAANAHLADSRASGERYPRRLLRRKAEDVILPGPFGWQIDEAGYSHAMRKPPLYGGSDQIRGEERKRDRLVHLADAAALSFCDTFAGCCWILDEFIEPTTSAGDRRD